VLANLHQLQLEAMVLIQLAIDQQPPNLVIGHPLIAQHKPQVSEDQLQTQS
jgi:hypothetical protein